MTDATCRGEWLRPTSDLWSFVDRSAPGECWEWQGAKDRRGYGRAWNGERAGFAHRAAYEVGFGVGPGDHMVCHRCDNPGCCNPAHLFLGSRADNNRDANLKGFGRAAVGEGNHRAKLTDAEVAEIRSRYRAGAVTQGTLADRFGVNPSQISRIISGARRSLVATGRGCYAA